MVAKLPMCSDQKSLAIPDHMIIVHWTVNTMLVVTDTNMKCVGKVPGNAFLLTLFTTG